MAYLARIMYIENKGGAFEERWGYVESTGGELTGPARIGRVEFSKTGKTIYYQDRELRSLKGRGFKANFFDVNTGEHFWISGPKRRGEDSLYATNIGAEIDEDVREEYWTEIRKQPERKAEKHT